VGGVRAVGGGGDAGGVGWALWLGVRGAGGGVGVGGGGGWVGGGGGGAGGGVVGGGGVGRCGGFVGGGGVVTRVRRVIRPSDDGGDRTHPFGMGGWMVLDGANRTR